LVSESSWTRHSLEFKGHSGTSIDVTEFEVTSSQAGIGIEELPRAVIVFRELFVVDGFIEFTVVVQNVDGFFTEKLADFSVLPQHISKIGFFEIRVKSLVSDSSVPEEPRQDGEELETEGDIREHVERSGKPGKEVELEGVVQSVSSLPPLIQTW